MTAVRTLLLWALLFYNVLAWNGRGLGNYDYEELEAAKHHAMLDDHREWMKKGPKEIEHKDWEDRRARRHDYDSPHYNFEDLERKGRARDMDGIDFRYKGHRRQYEDIDLNPPPAKSGEIYETKRDNEKKSITAMNCDRIHERYETCFAGCAAVTCDNPRERLRPCYPFCEQGCVCAHPYVRDDRTHKCVMPDECTKGLKGIPDLNGDST